MIHPPGVLAFCCRHSLFRLNVQSDVLNKVTANILFYLTVYNVQCYLWLLQDC